MLLRASRQGDPDSGEHDAHAQQPLERPVGVRCDRTREGRIDTPPAHVSQLRAMADPLAAPSITPEIAVLIALESEREGRECVVRRDAVSLCVEEAAQAADPAGSAEDTHANNEHRD